jgi:hypothetical protein
VPTVDLIPARKLERRNEVEQHQQELETEFKARFPALYRKSQAMRSSSAVEEPPSPPPPFESEPQEGQSFRNVDWIRAGKDDDGNFEMRKAPLVGALASGLEKMRAAGHITPASSASTPQGYGFTADYHGKGRMDLYEDDYDQDYDEIDPRSEELENDAGFREAGVPGVAESGSGTGKTTHERRGGEDTLNLSNKTSKKRSQIWDRLRSGGGK